MHKYRGRGGVGEHEQAYRDVAILLGERSGVGGRRWGDAAPLALGVAPHVAEEGLVGPKAAAAFGAWRRHFSGGFGRRPEELGALLSRVFGGGAAAADGEIGEEVAADVGVGALHLRRITVARPNLAKPKI